MARKDVLPVVRYTLAATAIAGGVMYAAQGRPWYSILIPFGLGLLFIVWFGRLFGVGVSRSATEVVCRFLPWREGNFYTGMTIPLIGAGAVAAGNAGESMRQWGPGAQRVFGIVLLAVTPLLILGATRQWRRCRLSIGRSALTVGVIKPGPTPIQIPREDIEAITTEIVTPGVTQTIIKVPQVDIVYRSHSPAVPVKTIQIGPKIAGESGLQLSVKPENLARALTAWKNGTADDPELLDRVEAILRGRPG